LLNESEADNGENPDDEFEVEELTHHLQLHSIVSINCAALTLYRTDFVGLLATRFVRLAQC